MSAEPRDQSLPLPTREQLAALLDVALGQRRLPRPIVAYESLCWLLDDRRGRGDRTIRRRIFRGLVRDLQREFDLVYTRQMSAENGPWSFPEVHQASLRSRRMVRSLKWCAFRHLLHLPGAASAAEQIFLSLRDYYERLFTAPLAVSQGD